MSKNIEENEKYNGYCKKCLCCPVEWVVCYRCAGQGRLPLQNNEICDTCDEKGGWEICLGNCDERGSHKSKENM